MEELLATAASVCFIIAVLALVLAVLLFFTTDVPGALRFLFRKASPKTANGRRAVTEVAPVARPESTSTIDVAGEDEPEDATDILIDDDPETLGRVKGEVDRATGVLVVDTDENEAPIDDGPAAEDDSVVDIGFSYVSLYYEIAVHTEETV